MTEPIIEQLSKKKTEVEAKIKSLKDEIFVLTAKSKSIDKAIKALNDGQGK